MGQLLGSSLSSRLIPVLMPVPWAATMPGTDNSNSSMLTNVARPTARHFSITALLSARKGTASMRGLGAICKHSMTVSCQEATGVARFPTALSERGLRRATLPGQGDLVGPQQAVIGQTRDRREVAMR